MIYNHRQLKQYRQMRLIGLGNFVDVYEGENKRKHKVLIKQLHSRLSQDDRNAFLAEGRTVIKLDHPHLLKANLLAEDHRPPYLVLDYSTHSLFHQRHPVGDVLPPALIGRYIRQIADAIAYMHRQGLIHQHLRPENLLLSENGEILLADLGIMALIRQTGSQEIYQPVNAALYMAPELFLGVSKPASDQYSLAAIAYEWLTGRPLLQGTPDEIFRQCFTIPPSSQLRDSKQIPSTLKQVLLKALARNPEDRFEEITAFTTALDI